MALTEKMKRFCREYYTNGGNATEAYLATYDTESRTTASREGSLLLQREDITSYLRTLNRPQENKAISEREKKRSIIWDRIEHCIAENDDGAVARYLDILNKMDAEYVNINRNIEDNKSDITNLDTTTLLRLVE